MSTTAQAVVDEVRHIIRDSATPVLMKDPDALRKVVEAQRAVCIVRPDAKTEAVPHKLTLGARQKLISGGRRLLGVTRNMGSDGLTPGRAIRGPVDREVLDSYDPDWPTQTGPAVKSYTYDPEVPDVFYITPHVTGAWYIEVLAAVMPTSPSDLETKLDLTDIYVPAVREYATYLAFAPDDETSPNWVRAGRHLENFYNLLGVKARSDLKVRPVRVERE